MVLKNHSLWQCRQRNAAEGKKRSASNLAAKCLVVTHFADRMLAFFLAANSGFPATGGNSKNA